MSEANKEVALRFIEAMCSGDAATAASCLAPDAFSMAKGFSKFAGARYHDTIVATVGAIKVLMPTGIRPKILTATAEGDRAVVEFEGNAICSNGEPYCNEYCMVFRLQGAKIKQINEYFCTILADRVLWPIVEGLQKPVAQQETSGRKPV